MILLLFCVILRKPLIKLNGDNMICYDFSVLRISFKKELVKISPKEIIVTLTNNKTLKIDGEGLEVTYFDKHQLDIIGVVKGMVFIDE